MRRPSAGGRTHRAPAVALCGALALSAVAPASAQQPEGYRRFPYVTPAGDLDGDGAADTLSFEYGPPVLEIERVASFLMDPFVTARGGADGRLLWQREIYADRLLPAPVGVGGAAGTILVEGPDLYDPGFVGGGGGSSSGEGYGFGADYSRLTLTALAGATGQTVWSRTFDQGAWAGVVMVSAEGDRDQVLASHRFTRFVGLIQATPSPAMDALVMIHDRRELPDTDIVATTTALVIDGSDGRDAATIVVEAEDARPTVRSAGDLDGDGLDDLLVARVPHPGGLIAYRGSDGTRLWANPDPIAPPFLFVRDLGDVSGDGIDDLEVTGDGDVPEDSRLSVVDGATGAVRLRMSPASLQPVGDTDGDGQSEFLAARSSSGEDGTTLTYSILGPTGAALAERTFALPPLQGYCCFGYDVAAGDLDGDGIGDVRHLLDTGQGAGRVVAGAAVSGRTLEPIFEGEPGRSLYVSLDGKGDDLWSVRRESPGEASVTVQDGRTGGVVWAKRLSVDASYPTTGTSDVTAADLDADGLPDLIVNLRLSRTEQDELGSSYERSITRTWVLSGTDGRLLWAL